jgi:3D (Asp-Asp-Asp) domain-containing protein
MYSEEKNARDNAFFGKHLRTLNQKIYSFYSGMSPQTTARITAFIFIIVGALILYGTVSQIDGTVNLGFTGDQSLNESGYIIKNSIFDTYVPMVNIKVTIAGTERIINTSLVSVGEVLGKIGIYPDENDEVNYLPDTIVTEGMNIVVRKIDEYVITQREVIAHESETKYIYTIPAGSKEMIQQGEDGLSTSVLRQVYVDSELENETVVSEELTKKPVTEKVNIGLGGTYTAADNKRYPFSYYIDVIATAYGGEMFSGLTFTGKQVEIGMIAVDPEYIPLGSKVYVIGDYGDYGVCYAEDTGSKIIGKAIDIYMGDDTQTMVNFGRRAMRVYILK